MFSVRHQGATHIAGARGGNFNGSNSATRNADGSATGSYQRSGNTAAGGSYSSSGSYARGTDGSASGARATTVTSANGNTYQGQTTYTKGQGVTHTGACHDAQGNAISCR